MNITTKAIKVFLIFLSFFAPVFYAAAQINNMPCPPGLNCSAGLGGANNLIMTVIGWLTGFAFALSLLFLIIGGFMYITSGGNVESTEKAKSTVINALIGIVIIILSYVIISIVVNTVSGGRTPQP